MSLPPLAKNKLFEDGDAPSPPRRSLRLKKVSQQLPPEKTIRVYRVPLRLYPELSPKRRPRLSEVYRPDLEKWKNYTDQLAESEGFDVSALSAIKTTGIYRFPVIESSFYLTHPGDMGLKIKGFAEKALEIYNGRYKCNPPWELHKMVRLNKGGCCPIHWYYTIEAKRGEGAPVTFQAKVLEYVGGVAKFPTIRQEKKKKKVEENQENKKKVEEKPASGSV